MNHEREIAHGILHHLDCGIDMLDRQITDTLFHARRRALAAQRAPQPQSGHSGIGHLVLEWIQPNLRAILAIVCLVAGVYGINTWNHHEKAVEIEEIDSALLADDLPIAAYLDKGFQAWLSERSSQD